MSDADTDAMTEAVAELIAILDLERLETDLFRGQNPKTGWRRVFGGQVVAQALVAATRTCRRTGRSIRCTPISCCRAIRGSPSSTRSSACATARASPPAG